MKVGEVVEGVRDEEGEARNARNSVDFILIKRKMNFGFYQYIV